MLINKEEVTPEQFDEVWKIILFIIAVGPRSEGNTSLCRFCNQGDFDHADYCPWVRAWKVFSEVRNFDAA